MKVMGWISEVPQLFLVALAAARIVLCKLGRAVLFHPRFIAGTRLGYIVLIGARETILWFLIAKYHESNYPMLNGRSVGQFAPFGQNRSFYMLIYFFFGNCSLLSVVSLDVLFCHTVLGPSNFPSEDGQKTLTILSRFFSFLSQS